jgi:membrane protein DedA with SNARE-associated domain
MTALADTLISWGPLGILLLAVLDSAGIPLPAGVEALIAAVAALDPSRGYIGAVVATAGSMVGNLILFHLARKGGQNYLDRHTASARGVKFRQWFQRYGLITVFIPALLPIPLPLKVFVLCSGALGVKPVSFVLVTLAARVPRYFGMAYLGCQLGEHSAVWLKDHSMEILLFAIMLFAGLYLLVRLHDRLREQPCRGRRSQ